MLKLGDIVAKGEWRRKLIAIEIDDNHQCHVHQIPCEMTIYVFTDTNGRRYAEARWCEENLKENGYRKQRRWPLRGVL